MSDLANQFGMGNGYAILGSGCVGYPFTGNEKFTNRERLNRLRESNEAQILYLQNMNKDVEEALTLLDEHPMIEKMSNLIQKLLGRS